MTMTAANNRHGFDLEITQMTRRNANGGTWVRGTADGCRFEALVFADHAENPGHEMGRTRISKLWVRRLRDDRVVFDFDRGSNIPAADRQVTALVRFLGRELAGRVERADAVRVALCRGERSPRPSLPGKEFAAAADAVRYALALRPVAIAIDGGYRVVTRDDADRLEATGTAFAYLHEVDGRVVSVPVND
jgi:hypothetical protein